MSTKKLAKRKAGPGKKLGRICKLTPELIAKICEHIAKGISESVACQACGIGTSTLARWKGRGMDVQDLEDADVPEGERIFKQFWQALKTARAQAITVHHTFIAEHTDWKAHAWLLERRYPEDYGRHRAMGDTVLAGTQAGGPQVVIQIAPEWAFTGRGGSEDSSASPRGKVIDLHSDSGSG